MILLPLSFLFELLVASALDSLGPLHHRLCAMNSSGSSLSAASAELLAADLHMVY